MIVGRCLPIDATVLPNMHDSRIHSGMSLQVTPQRCAHFFGRKHTLRTSNANGANGLITRICSGKSFLGAIFASWCLADGHVFGVWRPAMITCSGRQSGDCHLVDAYSPHSLMSAIRVGYLETCARRKAFVAAFSRGSMRVFYHLKIKDRLSGCC